MIQPGHKCISSALATAPEKERDKRSSKDEEIQRGSVPCAEDDGVVFSSIRVTHKERAAAEADAKNASVWLTGTLGEKIPSFTSAAWRRTGRNKGKRRTENFISNLQPDCHINICQMSLVCSVIKVAADDIFYSQAFPVEHFHCHCTRIQSDI